MKYFQSFLTIFFAGLLACGTALADEYLLGIDDEVKIRAIVWDDLERRFETWDLMSGEYKVQADGTIALPISGAILAEGHTPTELSENMALALQTAAGMIEPPRVTVEVIKYRPFYILGDVARPGAYPSQPGISSVQALALAGGVRTNGHVSEPRIAAALRNAGALRDVRNRMARALARRSRLEAEIANADTVTFLQSLQHPEGADAMNEIRNEELAIFAARKAAHERELAALDDLATLLNAEIEGLQRKSAGMAEQLRLARERVATLTALADRGLTQTTRLADAQRGLIDLEGKETDLENNIYRARQRISENEREIVELQARRQTEATIELQKVKAALEELSVDQIVLEQTILSEGVAVSVTGARKIAVTYSVLHAGGNAPQDVAETFIIKPGDVLTVRASFEDESEFTQ